MSRKFALAVVAAVAVVGSIRVIEDPQSRAVALDQVSLVSENMPAAERGGNGSGMGTGGGHGTGTGMGTGKGGHRGPVHGSFKSGYRGAYRS